MITRSKGLLGDGNTLYSPPKFSSFKKLIMYFRLMCNIKGGLTVMLDIEILDSNLISVLVGG